jgi:hypothetical protein
LSPEQGSRSIYYSKRHPRTRCVRASGFATSSGYTPFHTCIFTLSIFTHRPCAPLPVARPGWRPGGLRGQRLRSGAQPAQRGGHHQRLESGCVRFAGERPALISAGGLVEPSFGLMGRNRFSLKSNRQCLNVSRWLRLVHVLGFCLGSSGASVFVRVIFCDLDSFSGSLQRLFPACFMLRVGLRRCSSRWWKLPLCSRFWAKVGGVTAPHFWKAGRCLQAQHRRLTAGYEKKLLVSS